MQIALSYSIAHCKKFDANILAIVANTDVLSIVAARLLVAILRLSNRQCLAGERVAARSKADHQNSGAQNFGQEH